jgi:ribosome hibernation promoting factor
MSVEFSGRNVQWTPTLRQLAQERVQKLERHLGGSANVRVVLSHEKHRFGAEVIATHRRRRWKAQEETVDPRAAMSLAFEKIDAQAKKDSERRRDRKHRGAAVATPLRQAGATPDQAAKAVSVAATPRRIVRGGPRSPIKPMSVEEAALRIENSKIELLVFRDSGTERISVLYRRRDGDLGLIVPEC